MFRLGSVVPNGVGGPEAGAIELIYAFLLQEQGLTEYSCIYVNQIGEDLSEMVMKRGKEIYINIRYPAYDGFKSKSVEEKNRTRLDIAHAALLRISEEDKKLDASKLEAIKNKILEKFFSFDFVCKPYLNKKNKSLIAKIIVHPEIDRLNYFVLIEEDEMIKCRVHFYSGLTTLFYYPALFASGNWKSDNEFIITGKQKEMEIRILIDQCKAEFKNLTNYDKPPYFEMMRADISDEDREKAHQDWLHSLPPAHAAIITQQPN